MCPSLAAVGKTFLHVYAEEILVLTNLKCRDFCITTLLPGEYNKFQNLKYLFHFCISFFSILYVKKTDRKKEKTANAYKYIDQQSHSIVCKKQLPVTVSNKPMSSNKPIPNFVVLDKKKCFLVVPFPIQPTPNFAIFMTDWPLGLSESVTGSNTKEQFQFKHCLVSMRTVHYP